MKFYATISELIDSIEEEELSYRNIHTDILLRCKNKDEDEPSTIKVPYQSVLRTYLPYFKDTLVESAFKPVEQSIYRFSPKRLSMDLYGTTELWSILLEVNAMVSVSEFSLTKPIKVFDPRPFFEVLNEILVLENIIS